MGEKVTAWEWKSNESQTEKVKGKRLFLVSLLDGKAELRLSLKKSSIVLKNIAQMPSRSHISIKLASMLEPRMCLGLASGTTKRLHAASTRYASEKAAIWVISAVLFHTKSPFLFGC